MSEKEEGVHKVSREPCGCVREPEQGSNRGAEVIKRAVLSAEDRLRFIAVPHPGKQVVHLFSPTSSRLITVFCISATCAMKMNTIINVVLIIYCDQKKVTVLLVS